MTNAINTTPPTSALPSNTAPTSGATAPASAPAAAPSPAPQSGAGVAALAAGLGPSLIAAGMTPAELQALAKQTQSLAETLDKALFLPRADTERLLRVKRSFLARLVAADAARPGEIERVLGQAFDRVAKPEQRAHKAVAVGMAAAAMRAEHWVVSHPKYQGWHALADELETKAKASALPAADQRLDNPAFLDEIAAAAGAKRIADNQIEALATGPDFHRAAMDLVATSKGPLYVNYWAIYDDKSGEAFADALIARHKAGVPVYVLVDGKTALQPHHGGATVLPKLEAAGVPVMRWSDPAQPPVGTHTKAISDGVTSVLGGSNMGDAYTHQGATGKGWLDSNVRVRGPASAAIADYLVERWNTAAKALGPTAPVITPASAPAPSPVAGGATTALIAQQPGDDHGILLSLFKAALGTSGSARIQHAYFIMTPPIERIVRELFARNVSIELFTNSLQSVDEPAIARPIIASARRLLEIAAEVGKPHLATVYLKQGETLHDKKIVLGDNLTFIATHNLHQRSEWLEHESTLMIESKTHAAEQAALFAAQAQKEAVRCTKPDDIVVPPPAATDLLLGLLQNQL